MGYIYKITNKIKKKKYIGKTERDIETRWKVQSSTITRTANKIPQNSVIQITPFILRK